MRWFKGIYSSLRNIYINHFYHPVKYDFKYFLQRHFRGWSTDESWDIYSHICFRFIEPLKHMYKYHCGYPGNLTEKEWKSILKQIVWSFEEVIKEENGELVGQWEDLRDPVEKRKYTNYHKRLDKGFELFGKYFRNLWY